LRSDAPRFAFVLGLACGCWHGPTDPSGPSLGERFTVQVGGSEVVRGEPVRIEFERIVADSRCAIDVVCITAGEARGAFRITVARAAPVSVELSTDPRSSTEVSGYRFALVGMTPLPRSNVRIDPRQYRAELVVSR
jgi:hypothetical protein